MDGKLLVWVLLVPAPGSHTRHGSGQSPAAVPGLIAPLDLQMRKPRCEDLSACSESHRKFKTEISLEFSCLDF